VLPQLVIQRLEPLLVLVGEPQYTDDSPPAVDFRIAYACVEFFADRRWKVVYTLLYYVVLCIFPVKSTDIFSPR